MILSKTHILRGSSLALALFAQCTLGTTASALNNDNLNYGFIYWENGNPIVSARHGGLVNQLAVNNPDVVIETGNYSLRLDCDDMELTGYDSLAGTDYMTALTQDVTNHTSATLNLSVTKDGVVYTCESGVVKDGYNLNVRLIETGQFLQRFDHIGLVFKDAQGNELGTHGRLEISAWPDRVTFLLDFQDANGDPLVTGITQTSIELVSPSATQHLANALTDNATLTVMPQLDISLNGAVAPSLHVTDAIEVGTGTSLNLVFDDQTHAINVRLNNTKAYQWPADIDLVGEYEIEVTNPANGPINLPLVFDEGRVGAITGTSMVLLDDDHYGAPTGQAVQISKNWHFDSVQRIHQGSWLRGSTMLSLDANETKRLRLKIIRGNWGGQPAASHAHLSLIGWGGNWKWDESALGGWGESMCFDPTKALGGSFISDVRPSFTPSMSGGTHNWTDSTGGGDFLVYYDSNNVLRFQKRIKTAYRWTGPNIAEIHYSGVTDDDKIRFTYVNQLGRTYDYHRRFLSFKYEFLQDVMNPTRLVYYQMAADRYPGPEYDFYDYGNDTGLLATVQSEPGGNTYKGVLYFEDSWLAIDDLVTMEGNASHTRRGIIGREFTFNGAPQAPFVWKWGNTWGSDRMLFDISSWSLSRSYLAGDVIEGGIEFLMVPIDTQAYWGNDVEFGARLATHQNEWQAVYDEVANNDDLIVTAYSGTVLENYPVKVQANAASAVLADVEIASGGIGSVPFIITDVPAGGWVIVQRFVNGAWVFLEDVNLLDSDYYQGYFNANGLIDYAFNITRPTTDLTESWRIRVLKGW